MSVEAECIHGQIDIGTKGFNSRLNIENSLGHLVASEAVVKAVEGVCVCSHIYRWEASPT